MGGIAVYTTNSWTFTWRYGGERGARHFFCNETILVQTVEHIQSNFGFVF